MESEATVGANEGSYIQSLKYEGTLNKHRMYLD